MDREPQARAKHAAIALKNQMLVWAGDAGGKGKSDSTAVSSFDVSKGTWQHLRRLTGDSLPDGYCRMATAWDEAKAYTFGGATKSKKLINDVFEVDLLSQVCRKIVPTPRSAPPPSERNYNAMVYYKRRLISYGGIFGDASSNELHVFDLNENTWTLQATTGDKPPAMGAHTLTMIDEHTALLFGGNRKGLARNNTYLLDLETWVWKEVLIDGNKPPPRYHHAACAMDRTITGQSSLLVVVGGWNGENNLSDVWLLDIAKGSWTELSLPNSITGRWGHSAIVFGAGPDFRIIVLFGGCCSGAISETTLLFLSETNGSWVINRVAGPKQLQEQDDELREQLKGLQFQCPYHQFDTEFPGVCFLGEPQKLTARPDQPVTISPLGFGVSLTVPPGAIPSHPNAPANVTLKTCLPTPSFIYPEGYTPISAVYHMTADSSFAKKVKLTFEHFANVENEEQASEVVLFRAKSSPTVTDGEQKFILSPIEHDSFGVGEGHCIVSDQESGFITAGALQSSQIRKRYAVLCSYSDEIQDVVHAAIAITVDDDVYIKNFREAVQQEWGPGVSVSHRCKLNISFSEAETVVEYPESLSGWNIVLGSSKCTISQEDVDLSNPSAKSIFDYPPRVFFKMTPTENAEPCMLQLQLVGFSKEVDFQMSLRDMKPVKTKSGKVKAAAVVVEKPTLLTLRSLSTRDGGDIRVIEETTKQYHWIGPILLNDRYGERLETIVDEERGKKERIIIDIYKKWMREDVNFSWTKLTECFRACGLHPLANNIEQHFGLPSPPNDGESEEIVLLKERVHPRILPNLPVKGRGTPGPEMQGPPSEGSCDCCKCTIF